MTYNYDPSTGPDLFTTHSDPCKKKNLSDTNCSHQYACPFRVNKCRDPRCVAFFWGERHVDGITVEQREVSVLFIAQRGEPQHVGTAICRDLPGIKRYLYTSEKTKRPGPKKMMSFWKAWNFRLFNNYKGNFYRVPVVTPISGVQTTSVFNSFGVLSRSYEVGPYQL